MGRDTEKTVVEVMPGAEPWPEFDEEQQETATEDAEENPKEDNEDEGAEETEDESTSESEEGEQEEESAEESEETAKEEQEDPEASKGGDKIPKHRFDEVNERRKAAEKGLQDRDELINKILKGEISIEQLKKADQKADAAATEGADQALKDEVKALRRQYHEAIVDGEFEKADELSAEIDNKQREAYRAEMRREAESVSGRDKAVAEFNVAVAEISADFPEFDHEAEVYDQGKVDEILELHEGLLATGKYSAAEALRKASTMVARVYAIKPLSERGEEAPEEAPVEKKKAPITPKEDGVKNKIKVAKKQPVNLDTAGGETEAGERSVTDYTEEEFDALPEATKRRLRGDDV